MDNTADFPGTPPTPRICLGGVSDCEVVPFGRSELHRGAEIYMLTSRIPSSTTDFSVKASGAETGKAKVEKGRRSNEIKSEERIFMIKASER